MERQRLGQQQSRRPHPPPSVLWPPKSGRRVGEREESLQRASLTDEADREGEHRPTHRTRPLPSTHTHTLSHMEKAVCLPLTSPSLPALLLFFSALRSSSSLFLWIGTVFWCRSSGGKALAEVSIVVKERRGEKERGGRREESQRTNELCLYQRNTKSAWRAYGRAQIRPSLPFEGELVKERCRHRRAVAVPCLLCRVLATESARRFEASTLVGGGSRIRRAALLRLR